MPAALSMDATAAAKPLCLNWRADTLTAMCMGARPAAFQATLWPIASCMTQVPISSMMPVSSAMPMKRAGGTMPSSGWCQRTSASTPVMQSVARCTRGWYTSVSSLRSTAWRKCFSISVRSLSLASMSAV